MPLLVKGILMVLMLQALLGCLIFGEKTSLLWWFGATLVLFGSMLICQPHKEHEQ
jgi:drug/metabolite transporter (DMT)-like permease